MNELSHMTIVGLPPAHVEVLRRLRLLLEDDERPIAKTSRLVIDRILAHAKEQFPEYAEALER